MTSESPAVFFPGRWVPNVADVLVKSAEYQFFIPIFLMTIAAEDIVLPVDEWENNWLFLCPKKLEYINTCLESV